MAKKCILWRKSEKRWLIKKKFISTSPPPTHTAVSVSVLPRWQVAVPRSSGRHTVGRVVSARPGWVRVEVNGGGTSKDVPEGDVYRLLGTLRLASAHNTVIGLTRPSPPNDPEGCGTCTGTGTDTNTGGGGASMRTVALGQDAGGIDAEAGLTHADFRAGELVRVCPARCTQLDSDTMP